MIKRSVILRSALTTLVFAALAITSQAQKLKDVQEGSVWAPSNIKIDGKLNEWDDNFKAYNKTTDIYYTISNDDKNLYFAIKSTVPIINNKILAGGMNFTINTADKKNDKDKNVYVVEFPLIDLAAMRNQMRPPGGGGGGMGGPPPGAANFSLNAKPDSAGIAMRRKALASIKEIKLLGFAADIPDTVISIYNEYSIKTGVDYDTQGNLTCEIAIPLKYLHISTDNAKEFYYQIKLNGLNLAAMLPPGVNISMDGGGMNITRTGGGPPGGGGFGGGGSGGDAVRFGGGGGFSPPPGMPSMSDMQNMISPTDFWGKYTLAKK